MKRLDISDEERRRRNNENKKRWLLKNPEYNLNYQRANKDRINEIHRQYRLRNPEKEMLRHKKYRIEHKEEISKSAATIRLQNRLKFFDILGTRSCITCGFSDIRALEFDHINGQGGHTNLLKWGVRNMSCKAMYYYLKHPEDAIATFQVLCANCNRIKRAANGECLRPYKEKSE